MSKLFDFIIGNPPYNSDFNQEGQNKNFAAPVYNIFMEAAYTVSGKVELITPARFLFRAGSTPSDFNDRMLEDPHFKILKFEQEASKIFPNTDIKGGVAISYHDESKNFDKIELFTPTKEIAQINSKVSNSEFTSLEDKIYTQNKFDLEQLYNDHPEYRNIIGSNGRDKRFRNNIFKKIDSFTEERNNNDDISVIGVINNRRVWRYIKRDYVDLQHENLASWKVIIPRANGNGILGEVLSNPMVLRPFQGYTQTFIGIGSCDTQLEAENLLKYVKSKFLRTLLSIYKVDQHNERDTWKCVPCQNFTPSSDIDWTKSIHEIDLQLYHKYCLNEHEIEFIESHVQEMT